MPGQDCVLRCCYTLWLMSECSEEGRVSELKEAYMPVWDDELPDSEE